MKRYWDTSALVDALHDFRIGAFGRWHTEHPIICPPSYKKS